MLIDYELIRGRLNISYVNQHGQIQMMLLNWPNPKKFEVCYDSDPNKHPKYKTWDGKPVKQVPASYPDRYAVYEFLDGQPESIKEILFGFNTPKIFYIDIETEIPEEGGFVNPKDATTKVLTVAIVSDDKVQLLGIRELADEELNRIRQQIDETFSGYNLKFRVAYKSYHRRENPEKAMLTDLFHNYFPKMPVMTGWNFVGYDWTFLVNRCRRLDIDPRIASMTNRFYLESGNRPGEEWELPRHRIVIDYMDLCAKWDTKIKVRESLSLDFFATELLGIPKIQYTGSLQDLYRNDYAHYLFYNAVDTILVQEIHNKTQYINIPFAISTLANVRVLDSFKEIRVTEGILRKEFRDKRNIVICRDPSLLEREKVEGGLVLEPRKLGLNKWIACYDFASLYPTTMRQNNIGPENFKGKIRQSDIEPVIESFDDLDDERPRTCQFNGVDVPLDPTDIICKNGAVFRAGECVTVDRLTEIYNKRKEKKKSMFAKKARIAELQKELDELKLKSNLPK